MDGIVLKRLREERGLSRRDLADVVGVSNEYIRLIENGERDGSEAVVVATARALGVEPSFFYRSIVIELTEEDPYSFIFSKETSKEYTGREMDSFFLEAQERYTNHLLKTREYVFLNDVLDSLGIKRTRTGAVTGWLLKGDGDGYISFDAVKDQEGYKLEFNVDGVIVDKI